MTAGAGAKILSVLLGVVALMMSSWPALSQQRIEVPAWDAYKGKFLDPRGRIIDDGNGNISHSEGQGYGLLLAYLARNRADFALIWSFTRTELLIRNDGLAAWKWSPAAKPHVTDINNATDGDILIAYALALAGREWKRNDYLAAGAGIARGILKSATIENTSRSLLLPAAEGFVLPGRKDGPIVNLSYWVLEALPVLDSLSPSPQWAKIRESGLALIRDVALGPRRLPPDWLSLASAPKAAEGFPPEFGYNALRIPLYLVRSGETDPALLNRFRQGITGKADAIAITDVNTGEVKNNLSDPGYRIINHILACVVEGTPLPEDVKSFRPTQYYPSTLHLLGLAFVAEKRPECL
ncbi:endoglucanase [Pararhizobium capsulatum DSM 1112]|uniref:cellulase n=1 Tax=Pararhizobium capsulatum DSM 1112 TaxID=1121113 RepID=A0ABU0BYA8_9HYPH|nr:glycosyl hydrolase family 8 [Pararhizobium capsulatum]MDQ0322415.1 endoglucanase [Pararhizobium capsulatum DSM 1112]